MDILFQEIWTFSRPICRNLLEELSNSGEDSGSGNLDVERVSASLKLQTVWMLPFFAKWNNWQSATVHTVWSWSNHGVAFWSNLWARGFLYRETHGSDSRKVPLWKPLNMQSLQGRFRLLPDPTIAQVTWQKIPAIQAPVAVRRNLLGLFGVLLAQQHTKTQHFVGFGSASRVDISQCNLYWIQSDEHARCSHIIL